MKKVTFLFLAFSFFLSSCQKDVDSIVPTEEGLTKSDDGPFDRYTKVGCRINGQAGTQCTSSPGTTCRRLSTCDPVAREYFTEEQLTPENWEENALLYIQNNPAYLQHLKETEASNN